LNRRSSRLIVHLVLAIALVLAQAGALLHLTSHGKAAHGNGATHAQLCGQCIGSSTVLGAAGVPGAALPAAFLSASSPASTESKFSCPTASFRAFRSRAPPIPA
jgi:hypothetical protein